MKQQVFQCWIELRHRQANETRILPMSFFRRVCLQSSSSSPERQAQIEIQVTDEQRTWIASSLADLATQLRSKYPEEKFESTLKCERDEELEKRRAKAMESLVELFARRAYETLSKS